MPPAFLRPFLYSSGISFIFRRFHFNQKRTVQALDDRRLFFSADWWPTSCRRYKCERNVKLSKTNKKTIQTKQGLSDDVGGHRRNPIGSLFFFPASQPASDEMDDKEILQKQKREQLWKRDAGLNDARSLLVYNENVSIDSHRSFTKLFCISWMEQHASRLNTTFSPSLPAGGILVPSLGSLFSFCVVPSSFRSLLIGCGRVELKDTKTCPAIRPSVLLVAKAGLEQEKRS